MQNRQQTNNEELLNDADIAALVAMSRSWVRKQRFNRRHKIAHALTVDPILIGSTPRYRHAEVTAWIASLGTEAAAQAGGIGGSNA